MKKLGTPLFGYRERGSPRSESLQLPPPVPVPALLRLGDGPWWEGERGRGVKAGSIRGKLTRDLTYVALQAAADRSKCPSSANHAHGS